MDDAKNLGGTDRGESSLPTSPPGKKARASRAQQIIEKARRTSEKLGNVQNLPSTRLEPSLADGKPTLTAIFAKPSGGEPDRLNLSFLLAFPGLTDLFSQGILKWLTPTEHTSRITSVGSLRRYWFAFLAKLELTSLVPSQIDEQLMAGFNSWLHQQVKADGNPLSPSTIARALNNLRCVFAAAPGAGQWLDQVPSGPRGAHQHVEPTEVMRFDELLVVTATVEKEILALRDRWKYGQRMLAQGRQYLQDGRTLLPNPRNNHDARTGPNLALALAMLERRYPGVIPDLPVIQADDPLLGRTVEYAIGGKNVTGYFYASTRDLVPLALSVTFATVFNPDTILRLKWKNIDRNVDRLSNGRRAVQFDVTEEEEHASDAAVPESPLAKMTGDKARAGRQLVRLLDPEARDPDQASLNLVLDLVTKMTARIRQHVIDPGMYGDYVFLYVQKNQQKRPKGFGTRSRTASSEEAWRAALASFIADNALPRFALKTIRATLLDYVQLFNRGDLEAARQVGNHNGNITTWTHYTSNLVKRLLQEATGETMLVRERWLQTKGKLDPRKFREWTDKGCATPGFACLDPFDSPRPNQKKGRLCTGYGECPDCPLAAARPDNPHNVMLYEALRLAIFRSVKGVTAAAWQQRWAPVVVALNGLLEHVPAHILVESRRLSVELPDIG